MTAVKLPDAFVKRMIAQRHDAHKLFVALDTPSPTTLRLNPNKTTNLFKDAQVVPWCNGGLYLPNRPNFTLDPFFHAGCYYPQEAGSMFLADIITQLPLDKESIVLDLCAAPGGKSTLLVDNLPTNSFLIANEIVRNRAYVLRDNLSKWGACNVMVTNNSPKEFSSLKGLFDVILVDAPCSGEGMFRKDNASRDEWNTKNADHCAARQAQILEDIWPALKTNGFLIYSTCTFNPEENELLLAQFCDENDAEIVALTFPENYHLQRDPLFIGWQCFPHLMETEGFYFAVLQKKLKEKSFSFNKKNTRKNKVIETYLPFSIPKEMALYFIEKQCYLIPENHKDLILGIVAKLNLMKLGTLLGEEIGNKFIPHYEMAMSIHDIGDYPEVNLSLSEALLFLKGNTLQLELTDGWHKVCYENSVLGWLKQIGARMNNYYPKELRIKMRLV